MSHFKRRENVSYEFFDNNLKYPELSKENGVISNVRAINPLTPKYDNALVLIIKSRPKSIQTEKNSITKRNTQYFDFNIIYKESNKKP